MTTHHLYTHLLQKRRASKPKKLAKKEKPRTTTLCLKPDAMPNKRRPVRRRSTVSLPFNCLRSKTWAHQPEELTCRQPWSESSEQYLQVPSQRGTSSSASSQASKCQRSPSPLLRKDNHPSVHRGHGNRHEARPPPSQLCRPSLLASDVIDNASRSRKRVG